MSLFVFAALRFMGISTKPCPLAGHGRVSRTSPASRSDCVCVMGWYFTNNKIAVYPIPAMYGIFTYIWLILMVNVGKYTIHGWYGYLRVFWADSHPEDERIEPENAGLVQMMFLFQGCILRFHVNFRGQNAQMYIVLFGMWGYAQHVVDTMYVVECAWQSNVALLPGFSLFFL